MERGGYRLPLEETLVTDEGLVLYCDDLTISGIMPIINGARNRLYVVEKMPALWTFNGTPMAGSTMLTVMLSADTHIGTPFYKYKCDLGAAIGQVIYFSADDDFHHWAGALYSYTTTFDSANPGTPQDIAATYNSSTGTALWTAKVHSTMRSWLYGTDQYPGASHTDHRYNARILTLPTGEWSNNQLADILSMTLNDEPFQTSTPGEYSGSKYSVTVSGNKLQVRLETTRVNPDKFVLLPEGWLANAQNVIKWTGLFGGAATATTRHAQQTAS
jgi:hypothetical protein